MSLSLFKDVKFWAFLAFVLFLCIADANAGSLPWEGPITALKKSMSGPVATAFVIIGLVVSVGALAFGSELSGVVKTTMILVLIGSIIIGATQFLTFIGGSDVDSTSAELPALSAFVEQIK